MFCPNCGTQIDNPNSSFCFSCGYNLREGIPNQQPQMQLPPQAPSKLWTNEPPETAIRPRFEGAINKANTEGIPIRYIQRENKAKCEWCYHTFLYYDSNMGYRTWYKHGFVYCPFCKKPLRHHPCLLQRQIPFIVYPNGNIVPENQQ